jgi:hypothetical protein
MTSFQVKDPREEQLKVVEEIVSNVENLKLWPKSIFGYPLKNNAKENLLYFPLSGKLVF